MTITQLFEVANLFVLPFWVLMIFLPRWGVTRKVMASYLPFLPLAGLYIYFIAGTIDADSAQALSNPKLAEIAGFFAEERATATGWVHFLAMDLFVGRWVYWEGQRTGIWTFHSLALCLLAGPVGLLSHILTSWGVKIFSQDSETEAETSSTPTP